MTIIGTGGIKGQVHFYPYGVRVVNHNDQGCTPAPIVLMAGGEAISCGTIVSLPDLTTVVNFRTNAFGRAFILQWPG